MRHAALTYFLARGGDADVTSNIIQAIIAALALAALIVSIIVARKQVKYTREQTWIAHEQSAMQAKLTVIEEARRMEEVDAKGRAKVVPSFEPSNFVLHNQGLAIARGVKVELHAIDGNDEAADLGFIPDLDRLPVDLGSGQRMRFGTAIAMETPTTVPVDVKWTDEAGPHAESFALSLNPPMWNWVVSDAGFDWFR